MGSKFSLSVAGCTFIFDAENCDMDNKPKRPHDVNQLAKLITDIATKEKPDPISGDEKREQDDKVMKRLPDKHEQ